MQKQPDNQTIRTGEGLKIMLVNNNPLLSKVVKSIMDASGFVDVTIESSANDALNHLHSHHFDAIVSDYSLNDMNGMDFLKTLKKNGVDSPFIFYSFPDSLHNLLHKDPNVSFEHNSKIWKDTDDLIQKIIQKVELHRARNNPEQYSHNLDEIIEERVKQLKEAQRFVVIGELATMIGHDMRNPLQVIINFLFILTSSLSEMSPDERKVIQKYGYSDIFSEIQNEISYIDKIVSDLHDYAKIVNINPEITNISRLFNDVIEALAIPEAVHISINAGSDLNVLGDYESLKHIFSNLFVNALHSMEHGGTLSLKAYWDHEDICILISDTGTGIPPDIQHRIFDPLFTTKPKGTGLGLSVVKRLIETHHGAITLVNSSPKGTTFEVKFASPEHMNEKSNDKEDE